MEVKMSDLLMFYGTECTHCHEMDPLVKQLEEELKVEVEKLETWHNDTNMVKLKELDDGKCGGVPFFYNKKNKKWLCGSVSYGKLKEWATG
jgi:thiol-disulfide isomerase/thioredoxin